MVGPMKTFKASSGTEFRYNPDGTGNVHVETRASLQGFAIPAADLREFFEHTTRESVVVWKGSAELEQELRAELERYVDASRLAAHASIPMPFRDGVFREDVRREAMRLDGERYIRERTGCVP